MEFCGADVPVYFGSRFQGYVDEYDARVMISRKEARLLRDKDGKNRRIVIETDETAAKVRALSLRDAGCGGQQSSTYLEELYSGSKRDGSAVITGRCYTIKKIARNGGHLVRYGESEGFARRRFNPDKLPMGLISAKRNPALPAAWQ